MLPKHDKKQKYNMQIIIKGILSFILQSDPSLFRRITVLFSIVLCSFMTFLLVSMPR